MYSNLTIDAVVTLGQEWHCTLRGPPGTDFEAGLYHLRILLPAEYPFRPPSIMLLTPNGRFELNTKV
jgi:ubiquitin-conjugating enzyme E2 J1